MKNPYWRKCVLHADSKDIIKRIPNSSIDFIFTDPPYNLGQHSTGNIYTKKDNRNSIKYKRYYIRPLYGSGLCGCCGITIR